MHNKEQLTAAHKHYKKLFNDVMDIAENQEMFVEEQFYKMIEVCKEGLAYSVNELSRLTPTQQKQQVSADLDQLFIDLEEYFEDKSDIDEHGNPNKAMKFLNQIQALKAK